MLMDISNIVHFGIYSESKNTEIILRFLKLANSIGWIEQRTNNTRPHFCYFFTIKEGHALKKNHYWENGFSISLFNKEPDKYINLDNNFNKAKQYLQIIGKKFPKYNRKIIIKSIEYDTSRKKI